MASAAADSSPDVASVSDAIRKPELDERSYRSLVLSNKLEVLLISDAAADKAAAAMDVGVGHASDPDELPGLAHFLEHMLFLGTEKYPDEGSYQAFLTEHGGSSNAFTAFENTNFYFDVMQPHLHEALDRFAQFFLCPCFTESATGRELKAVDSENAKNLQADNWRLMQLTKWASNPAHPFHKFGTGSLSTLRDQPEGLVALTLRSDPGGDGGVRLSMRPQHKPAVRVRDTLFRFHGEHYSANCMRLVVLGREPLDTLQEWVVPLFRGVPNKDRPTPVWRTLAFGPEQTGREFKVVPVRDLRTLSVVWPLPSLRPLWRSKPHRLISHLLGHEGEGSLLSLLKQKGWADALMAGETHGASDFALFEVQMDLSEEGDEHVDEIVPLVFQYLSMLVATPPPRWVFDECAAIGEMSFRFQDVSEPMDAACGFAQALQLYPPSEVLAAPYLYEQYDAAAIASLLARLTPQACSVVHVSRSVAPLATQREPWYGTHFRATPLDAATVARWASATPDAAAALGLRLPSANPFIATDFTLVCEGLAAASLPPLPQPVVRDRRMALWHKTDDVFRRPKTNMFIELVTPAAYHSPAAAVLTRIFTKLLTDELTEFAYDAEVAGLHYRVYNSAVGLNLMLAGYSHKLSVLLTRVVGKMKGAALAAERFVVQKDIVTREYANFFKEQPYQHAMYNANVALELNKWHILEYLEYARDEAQLTHAALVGFARGPLLSHARVNALCHGNTSAAHAEATMRDGLAALGCGALFDSQLPAQRLLQLPLGSVTLRAHPSLFEPLQRENANVDDTNSAVEVYLQLGRDRRPRSMLLELAAQVINKPCYHQLRTTEQLGYIVFSGLRMDNGVVGLRVLVQSSAVDAAKLDERVEAFLATVAELIAKMEDAEFVNHRKALVDAKLEKDKKLRQESGRYWGEIPLGTYDFERTKHDAAALEACTQQQLAAFWATYFEPGAPRRRKLSSQVFAAQHALPPPPDGTRCIDGREAVLQFKRELSAFPPPCAPPGDGTDDATATD